MHHHRPFRPGCARLASPFPTAVGDDAPTLPIAGIDPIDDAATALALIDAFTSRPLVHETLAVLLDRERRGSTIINVDGTVDDDSVLWVADHLTEIASHVGEVAAVIIASIRPGGSDQLDDIDRWLTIDEQLGLVGLELVEWFVVGGSVSCPRRLLGDESRWAA